MPRMLQRALNRPLIWNSILFLALPTVQAAEPENDIEIGGAARFQYSYLGYDDENQSRGGDFDLDTIRLNFDGSVDDILLSAEVRYYQYMQVIHHGWIGYDFSDTLRGEAGITKVPFGNLPFNSHSFFFSSNFYVGLEDDYDAGVKMTWLSAPWDLRLALFKNDELGGVDGFVDDRTERYSYDVIADPRAGELGETNTLVGRAAYAFGAGSEATTEVGISALGGKLHDGNSSSGDYAAVAAHLNGNYGPWNLQLQATLYEYDVDSGTNQLTVGAYAYSDAIPADATSYTANLAYLLPVSLGPVSAFTFYLDNNLVTNKSDDTEDTIMHVLGTSMLAGPLFTYLDFVFAKNQPFVGGSLSGDSDDREERINLHIGYYF